MGSASEGQRAGADLEIERKFLVRGQPWLLSSAVNGGTRIEQGYLSREVAATVRVRVAGSAAFLTVKGETRCISRPEFDYPIPMADALQMLELCGDARVIKTRYVLDEGASRFEVDVFEGRNEGLVVAELELEAEDQAYERPVWLGEEVSGDARYFNSNLTVHPFEDW